VDAYQAVLNYPGIFEQMLLPSMMRNVEACLESHGEHFEYLAINVLSAVTHT
jgi:hypothetical protein